MRWVKGQSGNPGGRPKSSEVRLLARKHTRAVFAELLRICRSGDSSAAKVAAAKVILAYGHGSPESVRPEEMPDDVLRAEVHRQSATWNETRSWPSGSRPR